ncbi:glycosyltransferase [Colwellia sp. 4_MG-2023]|uniref:glycosyltransferase n=1 Tax=unclassified Colwellia TaxID=196834 RepID=UPI0026E42D5A|nr:MULTISPECIES: glycosyltransferase [unclassified Colwellia]MDO6506845.1 glycosyltransferase [Colwellia sp. 5_MG-2023]MDO6555780.1 glycosyltransferase [Colwellia sp. 4_MG-2023]
MQDKKKSLLIITNLYPVPWGPNRASFNKQQFDLIAQDIPVKIVILLTWKEWLSHRKLCHSTNEIKYCPYFYIPKIGRRFVPFFQFFSLMFLIPWMKKQQVSALMASWGFPDAVAASMVNKFLHLPFFVKVHGTDVNENIKFSGRTRLMRYWLNKAERIFCASKALADELSQRGIDKSKLRVNYNGVNPKIFYPTETKSPRQSFVFVGSLITTKGVNELLSAIIICKQTCPDITLDILGEGPMKSALIDKINEHNLNDTIKLYGSVPLPRVADFIRNASVLVLPSYREGVPNVLLESFACGTPVIATRVGGIPEVVNNNVGILVDEKNSKQLANAMISALNKDWCSEKILAHAAQFDWHINVQRVMDEI